MRQGPYLRSVFMPVAVVVEAVDVQICFWC